LSRDISDFFFIAKNPQTLIYSKVQDMDHGLTFVAWYFDEVF